MAESTIKSFNRKTAAALKESQKNAPIEFIENPHTGKIFFTCGSITGYCSPAVQKVYETVGLDELQFAEVSKSGKPEEAIPCLMLVGNSRANVKRSL